MTEFREHSVLFFTVEKGLETYLWETRPLIAHLMEGL